MTTPTLCIGFLGGGQLARMSAYAAYRLGMNIAILEKESASPAGQLTHREFVGSVNNASLLRRFSAACDVITLENEFIDSSRIAYLEGRGMNVFPSSGTIASIQDKLLQKETLRRNGLPVPKFVSVAHSADFARVARTLKLPFVIKSRKMGYDGYGNALVSDLRSFNEAFRKLTARHADLLAEEYVRFTRELAVMVVRTRREIRSYPVVETIQRGHICHTVIAPAPVSTRIRKDASEIAVAAVKAVRGYGIFGIELFLTETGTILINEMAPRPHNSGHYTIEGTVTSQFENHVRAVTDLPLGSTAMTAPYAVMMNLLGRKRPRNTLHNLRHALRAEGVHLHLYGKRISREGRKMGHITLLGSSLSPLLRRAHLIERQLSV